MAFNLVSQSSHPAARVQRRHAAARVQRRHAAARPPAALRNNETRPRLPPAERRKSHVHVAEDDS